MSSFKSNENIHKKEDESYYVVSANKAISQNIHTGLKGPNIKYKLNYGWCTERRFTFFKIISLILRLENPK